MKKILVCLAGMLIAGISAQNVILPAGRLSFLRFDEKPELLIAVKPTQDLSKVKITCSMAGYEKSSTVASIKADPGDIVAVPIETNLRPGAYQATITVSAGDTAVATQEFKILIVSDDQPEFPVIMLDNGSPDKLQQIGFTHAVVNATAQLNGKADIYNTLKVNHQLDELMKKQLLGIDLFDFTLGLKDKYPRLDQEHNPYSPVNTEASNPEVLKLTEQAAELTAKTFGGHPALAGVWINPGARNNTNPSFGATEPAAFKKSAAMGIPAEVTSAFCPNYQMLKDFPGSRIIPDKYPLWTYYHWFWTTGDGWNRLQSAVNDSYYAHIRRPFLTLTDSMLTPPSFRYPESHVDCFTHAGYCTPEPLLAAYYADRLIAVGSGGDQPRMTMPSLPGGWSRSIVAPGALATPVKPLWLEQQPDSETITIAPDYLREMFWLAVSRKIDGLIYTDYGSLVEELDGDDCNYTTHDARTILKELINKVVTPLGPLFRKLPENKPEILILHSAASQIFAEDHARWIADLHQALQWGNFNVGIIYEDQIRKGGLKDTKILAMPGCEVLNADVYEEIKKFQKQQAGLIIADEFLVPGLVPDLMIRSRKRTDNSVEDKAAFQRLGADLRKALEPHFKPYATTENSDLIIRVRSYKSADYVFVINDKRTFGEYVGPWGKVQERGQSNEGNIYVGRAMNYGYDLVSGMHLKVANRNDSSGFFCDFDNSGGRVFLLLPEEINEVVLEAPADLETAELKATVKVLNHRKKPVEALLPMEVFLYGSDDAVLDGSGYYCATDGVLQLNFKLPLNEPAGDLKLTVKDLASGKNAIATIGHKSKTVKN